MIDARPRENPIIMTGPSPIAILSHQKTETRRLVNTRRLRVRLPVDVENEGPRFGMLPQRVRAGAYPAELHRHGAVTISLAPDVSFGLKPGEFDFVCPYAPSSVTRLRAGRWCLDPIGQQRLWVREPWSVPDMTPDDVRPTPRHRVLYRADHDWAGQSWRSPMFMPRWASRTLLDVTGVAMERLQDIRWTSIRAEGISCPEHDFPSGFCASECASLRACFAARWDELHGKRAPWSQNPWVWAITFKLASA